MPKYPRNGACNQNQYGLCPVGQFCNTKNLCQDSLPEGAECPNWKENPCGFGAACAQAPGDGPVRCYKYFSFPMGQSTKIYDPLVCP